MEVLNLPGVTQYAVCLGAARAAAAVQIGGSQRVLRVFDLATGADLKLPPMALPPGAQVDWVPDQRLPVVTRLSVGADTVRLAWGERRPGFAQAFLSDGSTLEVPVSWASADPGIASVTSDGMITGNRPGHTTLRATYADWLQAETTIEVSGPSAADVLLYDDFSSGTLDAWYPFSHPLPTVVRREDSPVLFLNGDGRHTDGIQSRATFDVGRGVTVEAEFRFDLNRVDRQRFQMCLEGGGSPIARPEIAVEVPRATNGFCVQFPSGENSRFSPDHAAVSFKQLGTSFRIANPQGLDLSAWTRVAFTVLADGRVSLFHDQRHWLTLPHRIDLNPDLPWRVTLLGASMDTEVLVRYVTAWQGARYSP